MGKYQRRTVTQIIGYRKDRLGARIIALGNLLWLEDKYGAPVSYIWPDGFESHDMAIDNPGFPIFDSDFQKKYLREIPQGSRPDMDDLVDIDTIRGRISTDLFQKRIDKGERFLCNEGLHPVLFSNERRPDQMGAFRDALARIVWAPRVQDVLEQSAAKLAALPGQPLALHVRRGDVLDKDPWMHKNWVSKFAPDEFYTSVMDRPDTATVLFSDTPEVVTRMASTRPSAVTLADLVDAPDLSEMQRDLVELLLMAQCNDIVAPSLSAFSSSAAMMGGMGVIKLPYDLPEKEGFGAYDILLERILAGPDSFHNAGDFAQSVGYAFRHALNVKRHHALYAQLRSVMDQGQDYAFYLPLVMALAIACGDPAHALALDAKAKTDPNIWSDDKMICATLGRVADHTAGDKPRATADFLNIYLARHKTDPDQDALAHYFFAQESVFKDLFQIDDIVMKTLCYGRERERIFLFPVDDALYDGALNSALPLWITGADWPEMFEKRQIIKNITKEPDLSAKKLFIPPEIKEAEKAFFRDGKALPEDRQSLLLLSVYSAALGLSGRNRRVSQIMFHCRNKMPRHPIVLKRLGNQFLTEGKTEIAQRNFDRAAQVLPRHPGLTLARAQMAQDREDYAQAANLLAANADQALVPLTYFKAWELALRKMKAKEAARDVIVMASKRFPAHEIFTKQWEGKL
jgi:hypothetical protein